MSAKTFHIVQQFEQIGKTRKLIAGRAIELRSSLEAVARAERDAQRFPGVVALSTMVDVETGEVLEDPQILFRHGALPAEFQDTSGF